MKGSLGKQTLSLLETLTTGGFSPAFSTTTVNSWRSKFMFQGTCFGDWNVLPFSLLSPVPHCLHMATSCYIHRLFSHGLFCYHAIWLNDSDMRLECIC